MEHPRLILQIDAPDTKTMLEALNKAVADIELVMLSNPDAAVSFTDLGNEAQIEWSISPPEND